jgi:isopenicillin N synthase-like dioxygenase
MIGDKGLQVKNVNNEWISIDPIPNTFVINIGDILEKMTRGLYKSTPHRAKNTQGKSRFSIPYFYDPGWDQEIKELELKVSEDELKILEKTQAYDRWDNVKLQTISGTYGKYLMGKISKVFPLLAKDKL